MMQVRRVALVGYMGAGKSTVARALGHMWGCHPVDLDAMLAQAYGPIAEQFAREGEAVFRRRETEALQQVLKHTSGDLILALGGGAWLTPANRLSLRQAGVCSVYLRMPLWLGWARVQSEPGRPLVQGGYAPYAQRFERRRRVYRSCDVRVDVYPGSPQSIAAKISARVPHCVIKSAF